MNRKHKGAHNELLATVWLLKEGYEVFRNVSPHGDVDIIAIKDRSLILFDVKASTRKADGTVYRCLTEKQIAQGIKLLAVFDDGSCEIVSGFQNYFEETRVCERCSKQYKTKLKIQKFCSTLCGDIVAKQKWKAKRLEGRQIDS